MWSRLLPPAGILLVLLAPASMQAQNIGINTDGSAPVPSALLDLNTDALPDNGKRGLLVPRMTQAQMQAIPAPATSLLVYNTSAQGYFYWGGTAWIPLLAGTTGWSLTGNANTVPGTHFIGTTDYRPLELRVGNVRAGWIDFGYNAALGLGALQHPGTYGSNTAVGYAALSRSDYNGEGNTAVGALSLLNGLDGSFNVGVGFRSLSYNSTGEYNVCVGAFAGNFISTGSENTAIGYYSMPAFQTGAGNTALGSYTDISDGLYNTVAIGGYGNLPVESSDRVRIGNSSMTSIGGQVAWSSLSDGRTKTDIRENVPGLAFVRRLRPVTYHFDLARINRARNKADTAEWPGKHDIERMRMSGFIAQEVEQAARETGYDFSGVDKPATGDGLWGLRYAEFTVPLVKAVQELAAENEALRKEVQEIRQMLRQPGAGTEAGPK